MRNILTVKISHSIIRCIEDDNKEFEITNKTLNKTRHKVDYNTMISKINNFAFKLCNQNQKKYISTLTTKKIEVLPFVITPANAPLYSEKYECFALSK